MNARREARCAANCLYTPFHAFVRVTASIQVIGNLGLLEQNNPVGRRSWGKGRTGIYMLPTLTSLELLRRSRNTYASQRLGSSGHESGSMYMLTHVSAKSCW